MQATVAIITFSLFLGVVYLIIKPFLIPEEIEEHDTFSPELESQKNRVIDAIREIDMDYQTGKLSEDDYQALRSRYTAAAGEIIRRMDEEETRQAPATDQLPATTSAPATADFGSGNGSEPAGADSDDDDELERMIAERKATIKKGGR